MTLQEFIDQNIEKIDATIHAVCPGYKINNDERVLWMKNDAGLYFWAIDAGVDPEDF